MSCASGTGYRGTKPTADTLGAVGTEVGALAPPRAARAATVMLFWTNGALFANVVPRLPQIRDGLRLGNGTYGLVIAATGLGGLVAGLFAGVLVHRLSAGRLAVGCAVSSGLLLALVSVAPTAVLLAAVLFVLGALDSVMDVSMNTHAIHVQRRYGRSIINGFHGWWSVGAVTGGLMGTGAAAVGLGVTLHLAVAGGLLAVVALGAGRRLLPVAEMVETRPNRDRRRHVAYGSVARTLIVLCLILLLGAVMEDVPSSWSAIYLRDVLHASAGVAGLGYVGFAVAMTVGRFVADRVVVRFGPVRTLRISSAIAGIGLGTALAVADPVATVLGFFVLGLGASTIFPLGFAASASRPGIRTGDGIAVTSFTARAGFLLSAPAVGAIATGIDLRAGIGLAVFAAFVVAVLAGAVHPAT
jgi:MFS family permease